MCPLCGNAEENPEPRLSSTSLAVNLELWGGGGGVVFGLLFGLV